jgi:hypothetical protein
MSAGGNVGIGTTSPDKKLHVVGDVLIGTGISYNASADDILTIGATNRTAVNNGTYFNYQYKVSGAATGQDLTLQAARNIDGSSEDVESIFQYDASSDAQIFFTNATERMRIDNSGNLLINETSAISNNKLVAKLADSGVTATSNQSVAFLENDTNAWLTIGSGTSSYGGILFGDSGDSDIGQVRYNHNGNEMEFITNTAVAMTIDSSGNVGIGTSSPSQKLDVDSGHIAVDAGYGLVWSGDADRIITPEDNVSGGLFKVASSAVTRFMRGSNESMRIDSSGNVGIGTSSVDAFFVLDKDVSTAYDSTDDGAQRGSTNTLLLKNEDGTTNSFAQIAFDLAGSNQSIARIVGINSGTSTSDLAFVTENSNTKAERLRIKGDGSVGINTDSPISLGGHDGVLTLFGSNATALILQNSTSSSRLAALGSDLGFFVATHETERMRLTSTGLGIGTTSPSTPLHVVKASGDVLTLNRTGSDGGVVSIRNDGTEVGTITFSGSTTSYNTSSDARLKDITGSARGLEVINELNPVAYDWKADGKSDEGLIAQEVMELVPNAVSGSEKDMYQMDYSKLVVHLVKGMQEQQEQIESLKSEIQLLKGGN